MTEYAVITVTYFPTAADIRYWQELAEHGTRVFVMDNTPDASVAKFPVHPYLVVTPFGENQGLAAGFNAGIELAHHYGFNHFFLFDQDSRIPRDYCEIMSAFGEKHSDAAFVVPNFYDRNSQTYARYPVLKRFTFRHEQCQALSGWQDVTHLIAITSGMLISYPHYKLLGPFREDYFIDFIDNEYCLRAMNARRYVAVNCDALLNHSIGTRSVHRFSGITIKPNHHSPTRRYYISRNGIRTAIVYFADYPSYTALIGARMIHEVISILLYETQKTEKIKAILYGFWHGIIGKMGPCRIPFGQRPP